MTSILSLFVILILSWLVQRTATIALILTGLSIESARFQALSAFTGSGFTTSESEAVVSHPVRRRILMILMLLGNVGIVTVVASSVLAFSGIGGSRHWLLDVLFLGLALGGFVALATSRWVERYLSIWIERALKRWTDLDIRDYAKLLHLCGEYSVVEMLVEDGKWLADRTLVDLALDEEGILVLGIQSSDGQYNGVPTGQTQVAVDDTLTLYGRVGRLEKLDRRRRDAAGNECHLSGITEQQAAIAATTDGSKGSLPRGQAGG